MEENNVYSTDDPVMLSLSDVYSFSQSVKDYDDEWFKEHKLAAIILEKEFQAPRTFRVSYVKSDKVGIECLRCDGNMAMAYWYILIELDKDAELNEDFEIEVTDSPDMDRGYPLG
jgi:hypothetical protein